MMSTPWRKSPRPLQSPLPQLPLRQHQLLLLQLELLHHPPVQAPLPQWQMFPSQQSISCGHWLLRS
jgi:hypothetical protein